MSCSRKAAKICKKKPVFVLDSNKHKPAKLNFAKVVNKNEIPAKTPNSKIH